MLFEIAVDTKEDRGSTSRVIHTFANVGCAVGGRPFPKSIKLLGDLFQGQAHVEYNFPRRLLTWLSDILAGEQAYSMAWLPRSENTDIGLDCLNKLYHSYTNHTPATPIATCFTSNVPHIRLHFW